MDDFVKTSTEVRHEPAKYKVPTKSSGLEDNKSGKKPAKQRRLRKPKLTTVLVLIVLLGLAAGSAYLYTQYEATQEKVEQLSTVQGQEELNKTQTEQLLGEMRQMILLPTDEDPAVATIIDINQLNSNEFYKDAQNGDRVIVYSNAKKAYIYRPDTKMVINVGSFQVDETQQKPVQ